MATEWIGGNPDEIQTVSMITSDDWEQILKVLHYVRDNPNAHPNNIRHELMELLERMKEYPNYIDNSVPSESHGTYVLKF